jgi:hypothetical protein
MEPPIIARDRDGCLGIFDAVEDIESNLDLDDVEASEFVVYDSRGRLLTVRADEPIPRRSSGFTATFSVKAIDEMPRHEGELRDALIEALERSGVPASSIATASLLELVQAAVARRKGVWLP